MKRALITVALLALVPGPGTAVADDSSVTACLERAVKRADDFQTLGDLKEVCARSPEAFSDSKTPSDLSKSRAALKRRMRLEQAVQSNPYAITPHAPNYLLPLTYMGRRNPESLGLQKPDLDNIEMKLQISYKLQVARGVFFGHGDLYLAYTNTSWWQAYNADRSRPFRETNHEPEMFFSFEHPWSLFGLEFTHTWIGLNHESNGREGRFSRSWNRIIANFLMHKDNFYISIKPWWRIEEDPKTSPDDASGDDNPDITDFTGYGELTLFYKWSNTTLSIMARNNFQSENRGAIELGYSFPISGRIRGYLQVFQGYAESLIDYNHETSRVGIGVQLNEWL